MSILNKKKYILALSGGPDSSAVLSFYYPYIKVCCIVNYNIRDDSINDVNIAIDLCNKYKLKYEVLTIDKSTYELEKIDNFQAWARKKRYDFFYEIAQKYNAKSILTGHNLDDFLETAYMQKERKSKSLFYGIKKKSLWKDIEIYRPFVYKYRKNTLMRICQDKNIVYAIDSSNESDKYTRNKVRKILSTYSADALLDFYNFIRKYNNQNKHKLKKINKLFLNFKKNQFDLSVYNNLSLDDKYYLIYNFLSFYNVKNISCNKINGIIDFLNIKSNKLFRLDDFTNLLIKDNKICIQ